jgi:hypothetical protein
MRKLLEALIKNKPRCPQWENEPKASGWYVIYRRGGGMDVMFWGGEDDPCFEPAKNARYFGPFRLPL